jgi:hypothetical protein
MNGINDKRVGRAKALTVAALALIAAGTSSCSDEPTAVTTTGYAYDDYYLYSGYYPADVAYASYYWADSWDYAGFYYIGAYTGGGTGGASGAGGSGGSSGSTVRSTMANVVEALARGEQVCPGQVTVTPKTATPACAGGVITEERDGVSIEFNGCVASGQTINGMLDVQSNRSASAQTCSTTTTITLGHTTTITNLSIAGPNGKIVIPSQTDMGMTTYTFGQSPTMLSVTLNGEIQFFDAGGGMVADLTYNGTDNFTFSGSTSYSVSGNSSVQEKNGTATATITKAGLTRSGGCCRPTGGTITIDRTGGIAPGQATWTFGPSCGAVQRNNATVTMPNCL